jgi:sugar/nucleoside kinase (ribokinase family)
MKNEHSIEVVIFGDYFCDLIITGLSEIPRLGADVFGDAMEIAPGGAYILAIALHRLGVRVRWAARLGNDLFSQFLKGEAEREGLDTTLFQYFPKPFRSVSISFSFTHDRGFISYIDPEPASLPWKLIETHKPRWVVNAPFDGSAESLRFVEYVHQHNGRIFTDCQYVTLTLDEPGITELLRAIDIFAPNQSEACQLTGESDPEKAAARLAEFCPLVVVKCGADGAIARSGSWVWHSPAIQVEVKDTTGAGDSFNAGFLAAHLRGEPLETCLRYGNICGGLSVTQRGGASAAPTLAALKKYLQE